MVMNKQSSECEYRCVGRSCHAIATMKTSRLFIYFRLVFVLFISLYALVLYKITPMETSGGFPSLQRPLTTNATTCEQEYRRVTASRTPGLTVEDLEHSRAYMGNRYRLGLFTEKLKARKKVNVIVCGGSITLGHGITPQTDRYSDQLEVWLNGMYPTTSKHKVLNYGSHGADVSQRSLCGVDLAHHRFPDVRHGETNQSNGLTRQS